MDPQDPNEPLPTTAVEGGAPPPGPAAPQPQWGAPPPPLPPWTPPQASIPPPPPPRRDRLALFVVLLVFGGLFVVFFAFLLLAYTAVRGESPRLATGPRIGVVEVKGPIGMGRGTVDAEEVMKLLKRYAEDSDMKAIVVRIDSPGGAVAPSQEIHDELRRVAEDKVVVCSLGSIAASGGLYVAMGCDRIVAEPGTLTGSIGVISQFPNVKGLADKLAVKVETVKSGKLKDLGNPFADMSPEARAYWQQLIDQVHRQFVAAVAEGRDMSEEDVRQFADGRVLTGEQAHQLGLVDQLGNFHDAVDLAKEEASIKGEPRLVYPPDDRARFFEELFGGAARSIADAVRAEVRRETVAAEGPGVYYLAR
jgi:protease IV